MFIELQPLLAGRLLVLTVAAIEQGHIRVNVLPKCTDDDSADKALAAPLSITGTAEELDRELPAQLREYAALMVESGSNLRQVREAHKAALKALEAENKKTLDSRRKAPSKTDADPDNKAASQEGKSASLTKPAAASPVASLFDDLPPSAEGEPSSSDEDGTAA